MMVMNFLFSSNECHIHYHNKVVSKGIMVNGLYILELHESIRHRDVNVTSTSSRKRFRGESVDLKHLWHHRPGHINERRINKLAKRGLIDPVGSEPGLTCESCLLGKMAKSPFVGQSGRASELLGLIHTDVCGSFSVIVRGGYNYFITFTKDLSRYRYVYLMKYKSETFEKFKEFKVEVEN